VVSAPPAKLSEAGFRFAFTNRAGVSTMILASTNAFQTWTALGPGVDRGSGQYEFTDAAASQYPHRLYRVAAASPGTAPKISVQPQSQTVGRGHLAGLSVGAGGSPPLQYNWFRDGVPLPSGTNLILALRGVSETDAGSYSVTVSNPFGAVTSSNALLMVVTPPGNDGFADRTLLSGTNATFSASNLGAEKEIGEPDHAGNTGGRSVWWTWVAPAKLFVTIDTIGSSFDTLLAVYTGDHLNQLSLVAADDDSAGSGASRLTFTASPGLAYQIVVDGKDGTGGAIQLNLKVSSETWAITAPLLTPRFAHQTVLLTNGTVLVLGGYDTNNAPLSSTELYDPAAQTWTPAAPLNLPRAGHTATLLLDGKVLVAGGNPTNAVASELYDPPTGTWTKTSATRQTRSGHTATLLQNGQVLVVSDNGNIPVQGEVYDPASGTWSLTGAMNSRRGGHTATLLSDGKVLVAGGYYHGSLTECELYDPSTRGWTLTGSLNTSRAAHSALLLPSGKVLVAGGVGNRQPLASAELFDPATGLWTATGSLNVPHNQPTTTLLLDGRVLLVGGDFITSPLGGYVPPGTELYDPGTGIWTPAAALNQPRSQHTATLLADRTVLVAGGRYYSVSYYYFSVSELYQTATQP
jgi:hypothetical protein